MMAHGQTMQAILLTSHPSGFPQGVCVSVCMCVLCSLQLYSRPPCVLNTTGFRSKSPERGYPVNGLPVLHEVTDEYTPACLHLFILACMYIHRQTVAPVQTPLLQWPCQPTFLKALILLLFFYLCALRLSADNSELMQHTDLLKVINISISFGAVIIICLFRNVQVDTTSSILVLVLSPCLLSFELDCVFFIRGAKNCHCGLSSGLKTPCSVHIYTLLIQKE